MESLLFCCFNFLVIAFLGFKNLCDYFSGCKLLVIVKVSEKISRHVKCRVTDQFLNRFLYKNNFCEPVILFPFCQRNIVFYRTELKIRQTIYLVTVFYDTNQWRYDRYMYYLVET